MLLKIRAFFHDIVLCFFLGIVGPKFTVACGEGECL